MSFLVLVLVERDVRRRGGTGGGGGVSGISSVSLTIPPSVIDSFGSVTSLLSGVRLPRRLRLLLCRLLRTAVRRSPIHPAVKSVRTPIARYRVAFRRWVSDSKTLCGADGKNDDDDDEGDGGCVRGVSVSTVVRVSLS